MQLPTSGQVNAGLRHLGTAGVTAATLLGALGVLNADQVTSVVASVHQVMDGLTQTFGGISKLVLVLGPVAALWLGKGAVAAASLHSQLKSIVSNPNVQVEGKIVVPAKVADAVPSDKVVGPTTQPPEA